MERAIHERFSRRSLGPRSSVLRALSRSTYNTYKSVHRNFFDILVRRDGRVARRRRSIILVFVGKKFPQVGGKVFPVSRKLQIKSQQHFRRKHEVPENSRDCESLTVICILLMRDRFVIKKSTRFAALSSCPSRRPVFFFSFLFVCYFSLLNAPAFTRRFRSESCIVTSTFKSHL